MNGRLRIISETSHPSNVKVYLDDINITSILKGISLDIDTNHLVTASLKVMVSAIDVAVEALPTIYVENKVERQKIYRNCGLVRNYTKSSCRNCGKRKTFDIGERVIGGKNLPEKAKYETTEIRRGRGIIYNTPSKD
jgi:hypothetical protein